MAKKSKKGSLIVVPFNEKELIPTAEDIGRYNAIDKALGKILLKGKLPRKGILVVSCRVFKKIISKAYNLGLTMVISKGAPTFEAVQLAEEKGITLIGF